MVTNRIPGGISYIRLVKPVNIHAGRRGIPLYAFVFPTVCDKVITFVFQNREHMLPAVWIVEAVNRHCLLQSGDQILMSVFCRKGSDH